MKTARYTSVAELVMGDSYRLLIDYRIASSRHIVKSTFLESRSSAIY